MAKKLEITLVRSLIGKVPKHRKTAKALGLRRLNKSVVVQDSPSVRGMTNEIAYLLTLKEIEE